MTKTRKKRGRGRPEHVVTAAKRRKVELRVASGWPVSQIAADLGVTEPTLRKHYAAALEGGWSKVRGDLLDRLEKASRDGSLGATKHLIEIAERNGFKAETEKAEAKPSAGPEKSMKEYIGKKEQRLDEARQVAAGGTEWGSDLTPSVAGKPN